MSSDGPKARRSPRIRRKGRTDRIERRKGELQLFGPIDVFKTGVLEQRARDDGLEVVVVVVDDNPADCVPKQPPTGSWAETALTMRAMFPDEDFDWDA